MNDIKNVRMASILLLFGETYGSTTTNGTIDQKSRKTSLMKIQHQKIDLNEIRCDKNTEEYS